MLTVYMTSFNISVYFPASVNIRDLFRSKPLLDGLEFLKLAADGKCTDILGIRRTASTIIHSHQKMLWDNKSSLPNALQAFADENRAIWDSNIQLGVEALASHKKNMDRLAAIRPATWTVFNISEEASTLLALVTECEASYENLEACRVTLLQNRARAQKDIRKANADKILEGKVGYKGFGQCGVPKRLHALLTSVSAIDLNGNFNEDYKPSKECSSRPGEEDFEGFIWWAGSEKDPSGRGYVRVKYLGIWK